MTAVLQRVFETKVFVNGELVGASGKGLYILLGIEEGDDITDVTLLSEKISKCRIFSDENGKMNLSIRDIDGEVTVVSNFTLAANYAHGNRPDYLGAAAPAIAEKLYSRFVEELGSKVRFVATGVFGADMRSEIVTDGPVTIVMKSSVLRGCGK